MGAPIAELLHSSIVPHGIQNTKQHLVVFTLVIYSFFWASIARIMHNNRAFLLDLCLIHFIRILYAYAVPAKALGIQMNGVATHAAFAQAVRGKWQSWAKDHVRMCCSGFTERLTILPHDLNGIRVHYWCQ